MPLKGVSGLLDHLIVTGANDEEHLRYLEGTLNYLGNMDFKLRKEKCSFMKPSVECFAFVVDRKGVHPHKVQAIQEVPVPGNAAHLQSFLGLVNYYRRFISDMAALVDAGERTMEMVNPEPRNFSKIERYPEICTIIGSLGSCETSTFDS